MAGKYVFIHRMGPQFASYRYRAQIPSEAIGATVNGGEANVLIFCKPTPDDLKLAKESKAEGIKIVADLGDDHFRHPVWGPIYVEMAKLADAVVCPTENMAGRIMKYVSRKVDAVIPDPYEEPQSLPHANGANKFLWFGNAGNLKDLKPYFEFLKDMPLRIVTGENKEAIQYLRWTPQVQTEELRQTNIVLMPHRKGVEYKSANRLVNAMRAGCFVVGSDHPSHQEFKRYMWTGNMMTGVKWAQHFRDELDEIVTEGQVYIEKFSPANVGKQWKQLLESLCPSE